MAECLGSESDIRYLLLTENCETCFQHNLNKTLYVKKGNRPGKYISNEDWKPLDCTICCNTGLQPSQLGKQLLDFVKLYLNLSDLK